MEKKKIIITLSKVFPADHPRAGQPTDFERKLLSGVKIHTIRKNVELWKKRCEEINAGEKILCVREWTGLPYRSQQREIAQRCGAFLFPKVDFRRTPACKKPDDNKVDALLICEYGRRKNL